MKTIYYEDELNDEFSEAKIDPIKIDGKYKYKHNFLWEFASYIIQNFLSMPIKYFHAKLVFHWKVVGKSKFKKCKKTGYFIYGNHTQAFEDTFIPSLSNYPKRNYFIVNPENVSMKGMKTLTKMLGALPVPGDKESMKNFLEVVEEKIKKKYSVTIYPEAHIWPYYTGIRNYKSVSFKYPCDLDVPAFAITNTYRKYKNNKVQIITYVDGPFYADKTLGKHEQKIELRNRIYEKMCERAERSNIEVIKYIKKS